MNEDQIDHEKEFEGYIYIDEAGRGCVGGELVFCGLKSKGDLSFANDSKKLSYKERESMVAQIEENSETCVVVKTAEEIDQKGLSQAIKESLEEIIEFFGDEKYLYDGNKTFGVENQNLETLVKADALVKGVGAASIIAKHIKDKLMHQHHQEFPMYGFDTNAGYITKSHIKAIKEYGYCKYHRKSYKIKELEEWKNQKTTNCLF